MSSPTFMEVPPELLAEASTDVLTFCEHIKNIPDHTSPCGKLCGEIIALNEMLKQNPLDAFVLLPQIFCISNLANVTDEHGQVHVFARHKNAEFMYTDKDGKQSIKNIMHVIDNMKTVLTELCQSSLELTETHYNSVRHLLLDLQSIISK